MYENNMADFLIDECVKNGVRVHFVEDYSEGTPSLCFPEHKQIIINKANDNVVFELAHELAHVLYSTNCEQLYTATFAAKQKIEAEANTYAIELMAGYHFQDVELEFVDVDSFMNCYNIPSCLRDQCFNIVKSMYRKEFSMN